MRKKTGLWMLVSGTWSSDTHLVEYTQKNCNCSRVIGRVTVSTRLLINFDKGPSFFSNSCLVFLRIPHRSVPSRQGYTYVPTSATWSNRCDSMTSSILKFVQFLNALCTCEPYNRHSLLSRWTIHFIDCQAITITLYIFARQRSFSNRNCNFLRLSWLFWCIVGDWRACWLVVTHICAPCLFEKTKTRRNLTSEHEEHHRSSHV